MKLKKIVSGVAVVTLALSGVLLYGGAAHATEEVKTQPDIICSEAGYEEKVDWDGDGNPTVNAPEGFLIDSYCVKAGTTKHIVPVTPPKAQVTIDHPEKDGVSHYQVRLIPIPRTVQNSCPGVITGDTSTNLTNLWTNVDTRSAGHYEYVEGGLRVWTDDNSSQAKVSLGRALSFPLKNTGVLNLDWTGSTPPPGINLFVNFGADGSGTLVYESVYGQDLWLTNGSSATVKANAPVIGGGNGSQWHGTIDQWLAKYPDAQVVGFAFSLGSGVLGDGVINSITVGCTTFYFDHEEQVTPVPALFDVAPTLPTCDVAGSFNTGLFPIDRPGYVLSVNRAFDGPGEYVITATAKPGFIIQGEVSRTVTVEGPLGYQSENPEADCYEAPPVVVALEMPYIEDKCGTEDDFVEIPVDAEDRVIYTWLSEDETSPEYDDIRATIPTGAVVEEVPAGWVHEGDGVYTYVVEFSDEECPVPPAPPAPETPVKPVAPAPVLAATGGGDVSPMIPVAGGLALLLGAALVALNVMRRRTSTV